MRRLLASPWGRVAAVGAAALVVIAIVARLAPSPSGPDSSSYATAPKGAAAYADLLRDAGHAVARRREPVRGDRPEPGATLVVLEPEDVPDAEARAIGRFVRSGGRLVAGGYGWEWIEPVIGFVPDHLDEGEPGRWEPTVPVPETAGVREVETLDAGAMGRLGPALPVLGTDDAAVAAVVRAGRGRVVLLADASPLQNRGLARADNAAFGLAAAGPAGRPVIFLETVHGYGTATGLAALPARAKWALAGLLLAGLAFAWSRARRLGPPEDDERPLPPPRADYVDALAGALVRTRRPAEVAGPLRAAAREGLASRAALPAEAGDEALRAAAARFELPADETAAILGEGDGEEGALAAGRALARLERTRSEALR